MVNLGLKLKMTDVTDQLLHTVTLLPGRQSRTAPRRALHERPLAEGRGSTVFISQFDVRPELPWLQPQHVLVFASGNAHNSREQRVSTQINPSLHVPSNRSLAFPPTSSQGRPHVRVHNQGPRWGAVGSSASSGHRGEGKLLRGAGLVKQLTPSESSLQLIKRIDEPSKPHKLSIVFPLGYRISFHRRVLCSFLGARRGAQEAPPSAQCLSSSLPKSQAGPHEQRCFWKRRRNC